MISHSLKGVFCGFALIIFWFLAGVTGFSLLEDWSLIDAIYMAVITISTVGYSEVAPLSEAGRIFAVFFIIGSWCSTVFAVTRIGKFVFEGEMSEILGQKKMKKSIDSLNQHYIICGYGRMGRSIAEGLLEQKKKFLVIDSSNSFEDELLRSDILHIIGDCTDENILKQAGIERARVLLAMLPSDADNLYLTISARENSADLHIICRALHEVAEKRLKRAGADEVVLPFKLAGHHALNAAINPNFEQQYELGVTNFGIPVSLREMKLTKSCDLVGKSIIETGLKSRFGLLIIGIKKSDLSFDINPEPTTVLQKDDIIVITGQNSDIHRMQKECFTVSQH